MADMAPVSTACLSRFHRRRPLRGSAAILIGCLLVAGSWQLGQGVWVYAKAGLAQHLLQRAWLRSAAGERAARPWPWADTWPVARLIVPSHRRDLIVLHGAYGRTLAFGPGYVESSAVPGSAGTTILTGHRDTHFTFLQDVELDEQLKLETPDGHIQSYRVIQRHVADSRTDKIALATDRPALVLVTCYPFETPIPGGPLRWIVVAEQENAEP